MCENKTIIILQNYSLYLNSHFSSMYLFFFIFLCLLYLELFKKIIRTIPKSRILKLHGRNTHNINIYFFQDETFLKGQHLHIPTPLSKNASLSYILPKYFYRQLSYLSYLCGYFIYEKTALYGRKKIFIHSFFLLNAK